jgi:O-antigen ligase
LHPVVAAEIARLIPDAAVLVIYLVLFAATAILAYRRPAYALAVLIATVPFALYRDVFAGTLTLGKIGLAGALCGLAARAAAGKLDLSGARAALPIAFALGALVLATGLSIAQAAHPNAAIRETWKSAQYFALAAVAFAAWRSEPDERPIRYALLGTIFAVSVAALVQEFAGAPSVLLAGGHLIPRIAGPLEGPNQLAGFLGVALPLAVAFALCRKPLGGEFVAIGLGTAALLLTFSRGGIAAAAAGIAIAVAGSPNATRRRLVPAAFVAAALTLAMLAVFRANADGGLFGHLFSAEESAEPGGVGRRSELWHAALLLWSARPWLGIGAGNFEYAVGAIVPGVRTHANNAYLQALVEGGIPLAAATVAALVTPVVLFARAARAAPLILGALASCSAFALHQLVDDLLFFPKVGALYWLIVGLAAGELVRIQTARRSVSPPGRSGTEK